MKASSVFDGILKKIAARERAYWVLLDPDDFSAVDAAAIARRAQTEGQADVVLVGGSFLRSNGLDEFVKVVKREITIPLILFPGDASQLSAHADALLYISLISGRNPVNLIGEHVKAAPIIRKLGIEPIATAYMLVESGAVTSVEFMSNTRPLPRTKPDIAAAHALAAQYMGMKQVYLEAGSGAPQSVPVEMIRKVKEQVDIPVIVGGGIRDAAPARAILEAGADVIVTGNLLRNQGGIERMREIGEMVKKFSGKP